MHAVIVGNGIAGVTAAFRIRANDPEARITLISGESDYFFSRPALMYIYMGHMRLQETQPYEPHVYDLNRIERVRGWVQQIEVAEQRVRLDDGRRIPYDTLLLAVGSTYNRFGWPGQELDRVGGLVSLQDLEALEHHSADIDRGVIVGGGLIGIELAEMLHSRGKHVTMLVREDSYWNNALPNDESAMINRLIREQGIDLRLASELEEIVGDDKGRAVAVRTKDGDTIECQYVGLTAGVRPNLSAVADSDVPTGRGILVDDQLRTKAPNVFAAGDCAEIETPEGQRNRLEQLWYTGRMQGVVAADNMCGQARDYERGIWFNSAKFLDLEWHTYGQVKPALAPPDPEETHLWWCASDQSRGLRIVVKDGKVVGMNAMGLRHRHQVWERWLAEERDVEYVLTHLREANFDPEFYRGYEPEIVHSIREQL